MNRDRVLRYFFQVVFVVGCLPACLCNTNQAANDHPGHGKAFGSSGPFLGLQEADYNNLSTLDFFVNFVKTKQPIVLKQGAADFPAFSLWTDEYLHEEAIKNGDNLEFVVEDAKKEVRDREPISLTLNQFLERYKSEELYLVDHVPEFLTKDILLPQPFNCEHAYKAIDRVVSEISIQIVFSISRITTMFIK